MKTNIVYLLHFENKLAHAQHYIGSTINLRRRIRDHASGASDVNIMKVIKNKGIRFYLARVWKGDKQTERKLKKQGGACRLCPICKGRILLKNKMAFGG